MGDLCLSLRYKPASKPPALVCQIVQCRNLKQMDLGGASDPYVKVSVLVFGYAFEIFSRNVKVENEEHRINDAIGIVKTKSLAL